MRSGVWSRSYAIPTSTSGRRLRSRRVPDQIVEQWGYTGKSAVRAVERGEADITAGRRPDWGRRSPRRCGRGYSSRLYETQLPATVGLWLNSDEHPVRRRSCPQGAELRARSQPSDRARGRARSRGVGVSDAPAEHQRLPAVLPVYRQPERPPGPTRDPICAKARRLVAASGTKGQSGHRVVLRPPDRKGERLVHRVGAP